MGKCRAARKRWMRARRGTMCSLMRMTRRICCTAAKDRYSAMQMSGPCSMTPKRPFICWPEEKVFENEYKNDICDVLCVKCCVFCVSMLMRAFDVPALMTPCYYLIYCGL